MVQKAMVWRRKISIAQVMMFNVENTRRSKIFDNIAPLLTGVVSYSTRMKLDALGTVRTRVLLQAVIYS